MKRILTICLLALVTVLSYAQEGLFLQAMKKGRKPGTWYSVNPSKTDIYSEGEIKDFAKKKNYRIRNLKIGWINMYGSKEQGVVYVEFLPESEWAAYQSESSASSKQTASKAESGPESKKDTKEEYLETQTNRYIPLFKKALKKDKEYYSHHYINFSAPMPMESYREWLDYIAKKEHYSISVVKTIEGKGVSQVAFFPLDGWNKPVPERPYTREEKSDAVDDIKYALAGSRTKDGYYKLRKSYDRGYISKVLKEEGYFHKGLSGNIFRVVEGMEFAPLSDKERVISQSVTRSNVDLSSNNKTGAAYFYFPSEGGFRKISGLHWTGRVINGNVYDGGTEGYKHEGDLVYSLWGVFADGKPVGPSRFIVMKESTALHEDQDTVSSVRVTVQPFRDGVARVEIAGGVNYHGRNKERTEISKLAYVNPDFSFCVDMNKIFTNLRKYEVVNDFENGRCTVKILHGISMGFFGENRQWVEYSVYKDGTFRFSGSQFSEIENSMFHLLDQSWFYLNTSFVNYALHNDLKDERKEYEEFKERLLGWQWGNISEVWSKHPGYEGRYDIMGTILALNEILRTSVSIDQKAVDKRISQDPHRKWSPYDFVNPDMMSNKEQEGQKLVARLRASSVFTPVNKDATCDEILRNLNAMAEQYADNVDDFVSRFSGNRLDVAVAADSKGIIDTGRSKAPSGERINSYAHLFSDEVIGYYYENAGEIRFNNTSDYIKYQIYYKKDGSISNCKVEGGAPNILKHLSSYNFDSSKEMTNAIVDAYIKAYY